MVHLTEKQFSKLHLFHPPILNSLSNPDPGHDKLAITQLQQAIRLVRDNPTLLLAIDYKAEPIFLSLLDAALGEMQVCFQRYQNIIRNQRYAVLTDSERQCAREAVFSGIIALQLFIAL